jgi:sugar phosphate permease
MRKNKEHAGQAQNNPAQKMLKYRWVIFFLLCTAYILVRFHRQSMAVISIDLVQDFQLDPLSLGVLSSMNFYPYSFMQIPAGLMADSIGPRRLTSVAFALAGLGTVMFACALTFPVAVGARFIIGLGLACIYVPTLKILSVWFRTNEFATLTGILNSVGSLGGLIAAAPLALIVAATGWRNALLVIGVVTVVIAAVIYLIVRNNPREVGLPTIAEIDGFAPTQGGRAERMPTGQAMKLAFTNKYAWILYVRGFIANASGAALQSLWGVPFLISVYGMTRLQASSTIMMMAIGSLITSPIGGYLSDRVLRSRKKLFVFSAVVNYCFWIPLAFFTDKLSPQFLAIQFLCMGLTMGLGMGSAFAMAKELFPPTMTGTVNGVNNFFGMLGGAVFQVILGYIIRLYSPVADVYTAQGFHMAYLFVFTTLTGSVLLTLFTKETYKGSEAVPAKAKAETV